MYDLKLQPKPCQLEYQKKFYLFIELFSKVASKCSEYERLGRDPMDLVHDFIDDVSPEINIQISEIKKQDQFGYGDAISLIINFYFSPFENNARRYN